MEATDPASGQVYLEHVNSGESRWKVHDDQTATGGEGRLREEAAAAGAAGPAGKDNGTGVNEGGSAATLGPKVGTHGK